MKKTTKNKADRKMNRRTGAFALALALLLLFACIVIVMASLAPALNFFSSPTPANNIYPTADAVSSPVTTHLHNQPMEQTDPL